MDAAKSTYFDFDIENNDKDLNLKLVIMWEYQNIFAKGYTPNWSEEVFVVKEVKNTVLWTHVVSFSTFFKLKK